MVSKLSAKSQFWAIHPADTTDGKVHRIRESPSFIPAPCLLSLGWVRIKIFVCQFSRPVARGGGSGGSQEPPFYEPPFSENMNPPLMNSPPYLPHSYYNRQIQRDHCKPCSNLYHVNNNLWWSSIAYVCGNHGDNDCPSLLQSSLSLNPFEVGSDYCFRGPTPHIQGQLCTHLYGSTQNVT